MGQIKVSELFYSIQGEGRYQGVPSIFLRTFGCNLTCDCFGMPKGQKSDERFNIKAEIYKDYKSLPLVSTGCDSYASWDPRFKHLSPVRSTDDIADSIISLLPKNRWEDVHLVITGGEPLLGWQKEYIDLLNHPAMDELNQLTFETNGTKLLSKDLELYLNDWVWDRDDNSEALTFSVSPKLSCSGETKDKAINPDVVCQYQEVGFTYLKFAVAAEEDVNEALEATELYRENGFNGPVYLMPIGGVESVYRLNNRNVAELAMKHGLRYSDRLQVPLFKNAWGT